jgi:AraC-like DNA-binding protein
MVAKRVPPAGSRAGRRPEESRIEFLGTDRDWRFSPSSRHPRVIYQIGDEGRYRQGRRWFQLKRGDALLSRGGSLRGEGDGEFIHLQFAPSLFDDIPEVCPREDGKAVQRGPTVVSISLHLQDAFEHLLITIFREKEGSVPGSAAVIRACLIQVIAFIHRVETGTIPYWQQDESVTALVYRNRVLRVARYVARHYQDPLRLDQLAAMAGLNRTTFCRIHKAATGHTPMEHVAMIRTERAREMLARTDLTVSEVAYSVGFNDVSTFFRTFRRYCGTSPEVYRKEARDTPPAGTA